MHFANDDPPTNSRVIFLLLLELLLSGENFRELCGCASPRGRGQKRVVSGTETHAFHALPDSEIYTPEYIILKGSVGKNSASIDAPAICLRRERGEEEVVPYYC